MGDQGKVQKAKLSVHNFAIYWQLCEEKFRLDLLSNGSPRLLSRKLVPSVANILVNKLDSLLLQDILHILLLRYIFLLGGLILLFCMPCFFLR